MHIVMHEDDASYYCSDYCAREDPDYNGWYGCQENERRAYCDNCGVIIGGFDEPCDCCYPVVVNLIGVPEDEHCEHGELVRSARW